MYDKSIKKDKGGINEYLNCNGWEIKRKIFSVRNCWIFKMI